MNISKIFHNFFYIQLQQKEVLILICLIETFYCSFRISNSQLKHPKPFLRIINQLYTMGNSTQMAIKYKLPDHQFWRPYNPSCSKQQIANSSFRTLKNRLNGKLIDQYIVEFSSQKEEEQYKNWTFFRSKSQDLVKVFSYIPFERSWCTGQSEKAYIYIQHFPFRFTDIDCIGFLESLYLIKRGLIGFSELSAQIGFFEIESQLINFTKKGEAKFWVNKNLSKIQLESQKDKKGFQNEQRMVKKLIDMIQRKVYDNRPVLAFSRYIKINDLRFQSFEDTLKILDRYINNFKFELPTRINIGGKKLQGDGKPLFKRSLSKIKVVDRERRNRHSFHPTNWNAWMQQLKHHNIQQSRIITLWQDSELCLKKREVQKTARCFIPNKNQKVQKTKFSFKEISKHDKIISSQSLTRPESSFYLQTDPINHLQITLGPQRNLI